MPNTCNHPDCKVWVKANADFCVKHSPDVPQEPPHVDPEPLAEERVLGTSGPRHGAEAHIDVEAVRAEQEGRHYTPRGRIDVPEEAPPVAAIGRYRSASTAEPEVTASKYARILLAQEAQERLDRATRRQDVYGRAPAGSDRLRNIPNRVIPRRTRPDPTRIIDPVTGQIPLSLKRRLAEGWVPEWVSISDPDGRPLEERAAYNEDWGGEYVTDEENRPIEGRFGVAMMLPPEQWAGRSIERTPQGAVDRDQALALADELAETANSKAGQHVASVFAESDHGLSRRSHRLGREFEE